MKTKQHRNNKNLITTFYWLFENFLANQNEQSNFDYFLSLWDLSTSSPGLFRFKAEFVYFIATVFGRHTSLFDVLIALHRFINIKNLKIAKRQESLGTRLWDPSFFLT